MKIEHISIERLYNLGNYESVRLGVEGTLVEGEEPLEAWKQMETLCDHYFQMGRYMSKDQPKEQTTQPQTTIKPTVNPKISPLPEENKCPKCGGFKQPQYPLCYHCNEEEKAQ